MKLMLMKLVLLCGGIAMACAGFARPAAAQSEKLLLSFALKKGALPQENGNLLLLPNGKIIGTANDGKSLNVGQGVVFAMVPPTRSKPNWSENVVYRFKGVPDGSGPANGLTAGANGVLYGVTVSGGYGPPGYGCGVVYQLTPPTKGGLGHWSESVIYSFGATNASDGCLPKNGEPLFDPNTGSLYGTTSIGGSTGGGILYRLDPPTGSGGVWTETVLHTFGSNQFDGTQPAGILAQDTTTNMLYGTSQNGGPFSAGTVWSYNTQSGQFAALYYFQGGADAAAPQSGVVGPFLASVITGDQYLLGTSSAGGDSANCSGGCGTVFVINLVPVISQTTDTILHAFQGSDGADPVSGLVVAGSSAYGVASGGGSANCNGGCGTLFEVNRTFFTHVTLTYQPLYDFVGPPTDGAFPKTGVAVNSSGDVFGLTLYGGDGSAPGTLWEYIP